MKEHDFQEGSDLFNITELLGDELAKELTPDEEEVEGEPVPAESSFEDPAPDFTELPQKDIFPAEELAEEFSLEDPSFGSVPEDIILPEIDEEPVFTEEVPQESDYDALPAVDQTELDPDYTPDDYADDGSFPELNAGDRTEEALISGETRVRKERPTRKGRPRRRKGEGLLGIPQMLSAVIWLLIILAIGVTLGRVVWVCAADVLAFGKGNKEVTISITSDDTMDTIAEKLHHAGLIRYPDLFKIYADLSDAEEEITTGTFTLNTVYDYMALVNHMSPRASNRVVIEDVLIPEGYSCRQIFNLLEEKGICKAADLEAYAASGELDDYWFLKDVERGDKYCLEGFLFPDTYDFYENSSPRLALEKMLDGFNYRFTEDLYAQLPTLNTRLSEMMRKNGFDDEFIAQNQLDLRDMLTVASLIEEETANNAESYKIASVIYNRLFKWGNNPRYLNIDAAIFYALGEHKEALTAEDLQIDSPYNTYTHTGLVPGPISNPGLASIQAALNPEDTSYYYYVLDPEEGAHRFNKTYEAHEKDRIDIYGG